MEDCLVVPVWQNRQVHIDIERMTKPGNICKRTPYNCANYVDVGGHGALISPSLALRPSRQYGYTLAATGPLNVVDVASTEWAPKPLSFACFEPGGENGGRILYGGPMAGLYSRQIDDFAKTAEGGGRDPVKLSEHEHPLAVKVQYINPDLVTVAVLSAERVSVLRGDEVVAVLDEPQIDAFTSSPYIEGELAAVSRGVLHMSEHEHTQQIVLQDTNRSTSEFSLMQDVSFWTHPRHLALVSFGSLSHVDVRTKALPTKLVEPTSCPYMLPKELLLSAQVNPHNVNQVFLLASDTLSVWDVRYSMQPMAVFNHYVQRSRTLFGVQILSSPAWSSGGDLLAVVSSSERSTIFDLDPTYPAPNVATHGLQLQFGHPMDIAHFYKDQCGEEASATVLRRLRQPCAGSVLIPWKKSGADDDSVDSSFKLVTVTTSADWFEQEIQRVPPQSHDDHSPESTRREFTFAYGLDGPPLGGHHLVQIRSAIAALDASDPPPKAVYKGPTRTFSLSPPTELLCPVCGTAVAVGDTASMAAIDLCATCEDVAPLLGISWACSDLLRHPVELTAAEDALYKKLLSPNSGLVVSDEIRAAWGEVEWRVGMTGEEGDVEPSDAQINEGQEQNEDMDNVDDYD